MGANVSGRAGMTSEHQQQQSPMEETRESSHNETNGNSAMAESHHSFPDDTGLAQSSIQLPSSSPSPQVAHRSDHDGDDEDKEYEAKEVAADQAANNPDDEEEEEAEEEAVAADNRDEGNAAGDDNRKGEAAASTAAEEKEAREREQDEGVGTSKIGDKGNGDEESVQEKNGGLDYLVGANEGDGQADALASTHPTDANTCDAAVPERFTESDNNEPVKYRLPQLDLAPDLFVKMLEMVKNDGWQNITAMHKTAYFKSKVDAIFADDGILSK